MEQFYKIVRFDYLQRTRSYAFLVTLAISLYAAYSFIPAPGSNYTTLRIGDYLGVQNSAWIGYVTAMMSSVFLTMIGFYLVNSNIKKDVDTGVGMIIATTSISNFHYLLAKAWSNFMVLLTITGIVFIMGVALFFARSHGYPFEIMQFILPYLFITVPTIFFIAALAVVAEVFLYRYTVIMNVGFFFFFIATSALQTNVLPIFDLFGFAQVTAHMQDIVASQYHQKINTVSMGFVFDQKKAFHFFVFEGIRWSLSTVLVRISLILFGLVIVFISSKFFHRFDIKERYKVKKKTKSLESIPQARILNEIRLSALPAITPSYKIMPFIKTELLMLIRKGPRWLWVINLGGMIALIFAPIPAAHQIVLPILWFLQVGRLSDLATKEKTNRIHYFSYASYKPLTRLLPAQIVAGIVLLLVLAAPLLIRYLVEIQFLPVMSIIMGGAFIVLFAVAFGILSGGKKLFEILFFLFTYSNIELVPYADYFGGMNHGPRYTELIFGLIAFLAFVSFMLRKREMARV